MQLFRNRSHHIFFALMSSALFVVGGCGGSRSQGGSAASSGTGPELSIQKKEGQIAVLSDGKLLTALHYESQWDKPFLYPLQSASGAVISRGYPLETREGESTDHAWHRGIWFGHGEVSGEDFWRELGAEKSGKLVVEGEPEAAVSGGTATIRFKTAMQGREPEKKRFGSVSQSYAITTLDSHVVIDATITVSADAGMDLRFGDTDDGGFGFRLRDEYREDRGARLTNSEKLSGARAMWGKNARWVDYSADLDGKTIGFAMLDHPSNLRHPTGWHARNYALCAANPFAAGSFARDKSIDGSYTLKAGDSFTQRYRIVIHEGDFQTSDVDAWFEAWTAAR